MGTVSTMSSAHWFGEKKEKEYNFLFQSNSDPTSKLKWCRNRKKFLKQTCDCCYKGTRFNNPQIMKSGCLGSSPSSATLLKFNYVTLNYLAVHGWLGGASRLESQFWFPLLQNRTVWSKWVNTYVKCSKPWLAHRARSISISYYHFQISQ
jgi:hypothetical protein